MYYTIQTYTNLYCTNLYYTNLYYTLYYTNVLYISCIEVLKTICRELDINDLSEIQPALIKLKAVVNTIPRMEKFIKQVISFIYERERKGDGEDPGDHDDDYHYCLYYYHNHHHPSLLHFSQSSHYYY